MRLHGSRFWTAGLLALFAAGSVVLSAMAGDQNPCLEEGNLTQNCGFDTFVDDWEDDRRYQIPTGWWYFILAGTPEYRPSDDTYWEKPALWILTDGVPFTAGIYQQVPVTPGVVYKTDIGWAAVKQEDFERKLGLDPTGGTDPLAPSVLWSRSEWTMTKMPDLTVSARATGPMMTVFVWVDHPRAYGDDWVFLDAVGLWPDPSQPAATTTPIPSPTPTRKPPTETPSPAPTTRVPTASATATLTETTVPEPTVTGTSTATPTATLTPTYTSTPRPPTVTPPPTRTPLPTIVPVAQLVPGIEISDSGSADSGEDSAASLSPGLVVAAAVVVAILAGLVGRRLLDRRNRRSSKEL